MYILKEIVNIPVYVRLVAGYFFEDISLKPVFIPVSSELRMVDRTSGYVFIRLDN